MNSDNLLVVAYDSMKIYPESVKSGDIVTHRTEWENGWNAAVNSLGDRWIEIERWYYSLTKEQREHIGILYESDYLIVNYNEKQIELHINVSDTFYYACADSESITLEDLPSVAKLYNEYGWEGLVAWVAKKRNTLPLECYQNEKFKEAYE